jgi:hypothetical protein
MNFLNMVAAHAEGLRHPTYAYLTHFFSCQCPFKAVKNSQVYFDSYINII